MHRRAWLSMLAAAAIGAATPDADELNAFPEAWDAWAALANRRAALNNAVIDRREPEAWRRVEREFQKLARRVRPLYAWLRRGQNAPVSC